MTNHKKHSKNNFFKLLVICIIGFGSLCASNNSSYYNFQNYTSSNSSYQGIGVIKGIVDKYKNTYIIPTQTGRNHADEGVWEKPAHQSKFHQVDGIPENVNDITLDDHGDLFVSTNNGLFVGNADQDGKGIAINKTPYTTNSGLVINNIKSVYVSKYGSIYAIYEPNVSENTVGKIGYATFSPTNNLKFNNFTSNNGLENANVSACSLVNGKLYIAYASSDILLLSVVNINSNKLVDKVNIPIIADFLVTNSRGDIVVGTKNDNFAVMYNGTNNFLVINDFLNITPQPERGTITSITISASGVIYCGLNCGFGVYSQSNGASLYTTHNNIASNSCNDVTVSYDGEYVFVGTSLSLSYSSIPPGDQKSGTSGTNLSMTDLFTIVIGSFTVAIGISFLVWWIVKYKPFTKKSKSEKPKK